MDEDEVKSFEKGYTLVELQHYLDVLYFRYEQSKSKEEMKTLRKQWREVAPIYNRRVQYEAYKIEL